MDKAKDILLDVCDLRTEFVTDTGTIVAVDGVSLAVPRGRTVVLLGESGCGKSVTALSLMRLVPSPPGRIVGGRAWLRVEAGAEPVDLCALPERRMRRFRGRRIAMVFQEPMSSLNPVLTVGAQVAEAVRLHQGLRGRAAWCVAVDMLGHVGLADPARQARAYPHQMSGGMQQRVMLAMALACRPVLLIADEPTTALDVTTQAQILDLLRRLQGETGMSILLITHDLGVAGVVADRVEVMYAGRIVERGPAEVVLHQPAHPYTQGLLRCAPRLEQREERLRVIPGQVPDPAHYPPGCRFHPRCDLAAALATEKGRAVQAVRRGEETVRVPTSCCADDPESPGGPPWRSIGPEHEAACWELADAGVPAGVVE